MFYPIYQAHSIPDPDLKIPTLTLRIPIMPLEIPTRRLEFPIRRHEIPSRPLEIPSRPLDIPTLTFRILTRSLEIPTLPLEIPTKPPEKENGPCFDVAELGLDVCSMLRNTKHTQIFKPAFVKTDLFARERCLHPQRCAKSSVSLLFRHVIECLSDRILGSSQNPQDAGNQPDFAKRREKVRRPPRVVFPI